MSLAPGCEIKRDREAKTITMTQKGKIGKLLDKFGFTECRSASTPLVPGERLKSVKFNPELVPVSAAEHTQFMSAVGSIQYIASVTRPDFAFAASALARHFSCSTKEHWVAVRHVMRYLHATKDLRLVFDGSLNNPPVLEAWSDADFANAEDCKSVTGTLIKVFGQPVYWKSNRQATTAGDTTESELIALSATCNDVLWFKKLLTDLGMNPGKPTVWGDNQSFVCIANNRLSADKAKHLDVKDMCVQEHVEMDRLVLKWCGTKEQKADVLTKVLAGPALKDC